MAVTSHSTSSGADPGFEKGGGAWGSRARLQGDFLKNLAQKGVGVHPLRPPSGSVPTPYGLRGKKKWGPQAMPIFLI